MNKTFKYVIGADLGASNIRMGIFQINGTMLEMVKQQINTRDGVESVANSIEQTIKTVLEKGKIKPENIVGLGLGIAAQLKGPEKIIHVAPNMGWQDVDFLALLQKQIPLKINLYNDLNAITFGEFKWGKGKGYQDMLAVFWGSGVGSGLIINGQCYSGHNQLAGELGHIMVKPQGRPCGCQRRGCLEAYVGGVNIESRVRDMIGAGYSSMLSEMCNGDPQRSGTALCR